ncbi:DUF4303 domain-containing protein [Capnocytophaga sputigena]|uniref:DUF4303 domain-containing protein n=1 Tax=Capnocytophaga sputigena TaxID=1019 RepID=A0AAX2IBD8_CAPSP|nr:DUF4303 domain-containing protein [Capnocytophaga sputigena]ATA84766.1 hypothetical protein CGC55_09715 [Capnocytophaga sputigena]EEB65767.1 hypothetical protein CAPSP0001_0566 [Capnocytophaga sputigena ATCC 33612]SQA75444.1 Uncharacterised protein [Capnocytophaga sputigena]
MDKQKIEELTSTLCNSIVSDLNQMKDTHKQPYALALVGNDTMEHFFLALANTEDLEKILSENEVTPTDTDDFLYFKWSPNEWLCMSYDLEDSQLKAFNKKLREEVSAIKSDCDNYRKTMLEVCMAALAKAKPQIENSLKHSNLPIFVSFTDISKLQEIENYTALQINSREVYEAFSTRFAELDWGEDLGVYAPF